MAIRRRDFLKNAGLAAASLSLPRLARGAEAASIYDLERFGNARVLHLTDTHAQLNPVYFREPSVNIGIGEMAGRPPHLVGRAFLERFGIRPDSADAYAFQLLRVREVRRPLRQARRLRPSEDADRPPARRCRRKALRAR
ncbi:hypothetical protein ACVW1A_003275 [Bradyrhizobium sp. LB1.3]